MLLSKEITKELQKYGIEVVCKRLPLPSYGSGEVAVMEAEGRAGYGVQILPIEIECGSEEEACRQSGAMAEILGRGNVIAVTRDRWERQLEMMIKRLLAHCGIFTSIFARNCEVRKIDRPTAQIFMEKNHSYGHAACRYCYGLYVSRYSGAEMHAEVHEYPVGTLVAVAEFSNARKWLKEGREVRSYEWIRYASLPQVRVNGGMGKVLERFIADVRPDDIMSYADLEWSDGNVYRSLGFIKDGVKAPVMFRVSPETWERVPFSHHSEQNMRHCEEPAEQVTWQSQEILRRTSCFPQNDKKIPQHNMLWYQNFGSIKYRLTSI